MIQGGPLRDALEVD